MAVVREPVFEDATRVDWVDRDENGPVAIGTTWKAGSRRANRVALDDKLEEGIAVFQQNVTNWPSMTAAQKDVANRMAQRAILNLLRHARGTDSAGNGA